MNLILTKIHLPSSVTTSIVATISYKLYYDTAYTLLASGITILSDGIIVASPPLSFVVDPTLKYMLKVENQACGSVYEQAVIINPHCPINYELSPDLSYCFKEETVAAIPPTNSQLTVAKNNIAYNTCGTYIYDPGYNSNGTGTSNRITLVNTWWVNGAGACVDSGTTNGMANRAALWSTTTTANQTIGFSKCLDIDVAAVYYIAVSCDNFASIYLDGNLILAQNEAALDTQYSVTGSCFKICHIYPLNIPVGSHVIDVRGTNVFGSAALAMEIYQNTAAEIIAATSYLGLNLVFSTKDFVGMPVQSGSGGIGYQCPNGFSLAYCESPIVCKRIIVTNVLY